MGTLTPDLNGTVKVRKNLVRSKFNSSNTTMNMAKYVHKDYYIKYVKEIQLICPSSKQLLCRILKFLNIYLSLNTF